jgi:hypothetical protein
MTVPIAGLSVHLPYRWTVAPMPRHLRSKGGPGKRWGSAPIEPARLLRTRKGCPPAGKFQRGQRPVCNDDTP